MSESDIKWSPRVSKWQLRQIYKDASIGIYDDLLIEEVGLTLYLRCRDILIIHLAKSEGKITCPDCLRGGNNVIIKKGHIKNELIICPVCAWTITWESYRKSFQRSQLNPGGAVIFFKEFIASYDRASDAKAKMMAIDRIIHQFHYSLKTNPDMPTRPAGVNLINGKLADVVQFLDELSGFPLPYEMTEIYNKWRKNYDSTYWPDFLADKSGEK